MGSHALLSASSSKRWLNCPPSARLCAEVEDTTSEYAKEGTDAHTLCEYKVEKALGNPAKELNLSTTKIAAEVGVKDHTTVMHGIKKIEQDLKLNFTLREQIEEIKEKIYG